MLSSRVALSHHPTCRPGFVQSSMQPTLDLIPHTAEYALDLQSQTYKTHQL